MTRYEAVIGLEVHAELLTNAKMFCGCRVVDSTEAAPNSVVCPVCLGMPGTLPVVNRRAVEFALRVALALNCEIQEHNVFARKNYFYPDVPKGYQISQYDLPLARNGWLEIPGANGEPMRVAIRRVHLEEDPAKLTHTDAGTLIDYNRSGVPLLEIVSEPEMHTADEVSAYARRLRQLLRYLGVNSGDLEKGVFRVEPNISVRLENSEGLGTRTEVKNLNSFKALAAATEFEIERQIAVIGQGGELVQETRGWQEDRRETFSQRSKEEADDYRYFPDPDLPPLAIRPEWIEAVRASLPELPAAKMVRYQGEYGLSAYDAEVLAEERDVAEWYDATVAAGGEPKAVANWVINSLFALLNESGEAIGDIQMKPEDLVELLALVEAGTISHSAGREVLVTMIATGRGAEVIVGEKGLAQISDSAALDAAIDAVLEGNPDEVAGFRGGKEALLGWFVGQVMRATGGRRTRRW
jgi:aspartyl-tRNA(Asn)/glutamyl-tRNA(Gln) amidotransferase subunit B